jgi:N-acetylneuraminic acid mutarotase
MFIPLLILIYIIGTYGAKITNSTTGSVTTYVITQTNTIDPVYVIAYINSTVVVMIETEKTQSSSFSLIGRSSSVIPITISPLGYKPTGNYLLDCVEENNGDIFQCIKDDVVVVSQNIRISKPFAEITSIDLINSQGVMVRGGFGEDCSMPTVTWINVEFPGLNITVISNASTCLDNFGVSFGGMYKTYYQDPLTTRLINETRVFRKETTTRYQRFVIQRFDDDVNLRLVFSTADGTSIKPFNERILSTATFANGDLFSILPLNVSFEGGCEVQIEIHDTLAATTQDIWTMLDLDEINDLNWYRNALPTRYYTSQVCNFHVGRLDKNNLLVYPFTVEGEVGGGRPSLRTGGLFGSPIQIDKNVHFEDYDLNCDSFWPIGKEFNGYGLTGTDGSLYTPYTPSNQLCYSPFLYVNEIKNQELLLSNSKEKDCALQGGFTVGVTKDACAKLLQTTRCKKGHLYYAGFCYYKFDVETETRFFVVQSDAESACKQLNPLAQATTGINIYLKSFLQKKFVFWKRQQPGFPYRLTIKSQSCLAFDYQHNGDDPDADTESVYEISCDAPAFPLCRYPTHEVPIPHSDVLIDARTVSVFKNGQEGVPREGLQMECHCASGWCSDTCETACCSISQVLLMNDSLTPFLNRCKQGNRGACHNGNPRDCQCYEGFGPSVSWLEQPTAKIICSCPTTKDDRLYFSTDYIINEVRYNITARSNSICGGSSRGKCKVEETINEGLCICSARTDMNPDTPLESKQRAGYDGKSCTNPLPIVPSDGYNVNGDLVERFCNGHGTGCPNGERYDEQQLKEVFGVLYGRKECREINGDIKYGCSCDDGYGGQACTCPVSVNLLNAKIYKLPDEQEGIFSYLKRKEVIRSVIIDGPCDGITMVALILADSTLVECDIDDPVKRKYQCDPGGKQASQVNVYFTKLKKDNLRCIIRGFNEDLDLCGSNPNPYAARFFSNEVKRGDDFYHDPQRSDEGPYGCTITECMYSPQASGKYGRTGISGFRQSPASDELAMEVCGMSTFPPRGEIDANGFCKCNVIEIPFLARFAGVACEGEESFIKGEWKQCHGRGISSRPKFPYGDCSFDLLDRNADPLIRPGIGSTQSTFNQSFVFTTTSNFSIIYIRDGFWKFSKGQKLVISKLRQIGDSIIVDYPNQKLPSNVTFFCDNEFLVTKVKGLSTLLKFNVGLSVVEEPNQEYDMVTPKCTSTSFIGHSSLDYRCVNSTTWVDMGEYDNEETLESGMHEGSVLIVGEFTGESSTDIQLSYGVFDCSDAVDRILNDVALRLGYVTTKQCLNASIVAYSNVNGAGYGLWRDYIQTIPSFEEETWSDDNYRMISNMLGGIVALDSTGKIDELAFNERIWENMTLTWLDSAGLELTISTNLTSVPLEKKLVGFNLDWNYEGLFGTKYAHEDFYLRSNFSNWTWNYRPVYSLDVPIETEFLSSFSVRIPTSEIDCLQVYTSKGELCGTWYSLVANSTLSVNCDGLFVTSEDSTATIIERFTTAINNTNTSSLLESQYLASSPIVNIRMVWSSKDDVNFTKSDFIVFGRDQPYSELFSELKRQLKEDLIFPNNTVYLSRASINRPIDLSSYDDRDYLKRLWFTHLAPRKCTNNWQCKTFARNTETYSCVFDAEYVADWTAHGSLKAAEIGDEGGCKCNNTLFDPTFFCSQCIHGYGPNDQESLLAFNSFTNSSETRLCVFPWLEESTKKNKVCGGRGVISSYEVSYMGEIQVFKNNVTRRCEYVEYSDGTLHQLNTSINYDVDVMQYGSEWFIANNRIFFNTIEKVVISLRGDNTILFTDDTYLVCIPFGYSDVYMTTIYYRYDDGSRRRILEEVTDQNVVVTFNPSRFSFWKAQLKTRIIDRVGDEPLPPPTKAPTSYPSQSPSFSPSGSPTTNMPSLSPTTSVPSVSPSAAPSFSPTTTKPSTSPSSAPSTAPITTKPSTSPSSAPSTAPVTSSPSTSPSSAPSTAPITTKPSTAPVTSSPSKAPSLSPTNKPTLTPTTSLAPTLKPTTGSPTVAPTNNLGTCTPTGSMATVRHTLPLFSHRLPNGRTLLCGGLNGAALSTCELYNIGTGTWSATGSMSVARQANVNIQFTFLLQNGNVLALPGSDLSSIIDVYDWLSGTWSRGPTLPTTYSSQAGTVLADGRVLFGGGTILGGAATTHCFLYDPSTNTLIQTGSLPQTLIKHDIVGLQDGNAIAFGGERSSAAQSIVYLYTTSTGVWSTTGSLPLTQQEGKGVLLQNGNVLACGGTRSGAILASCFIYTSTTQVWATVASMSASRVAFSMVLLPNGEVQVMGGWTGAAVVSSTEIYTPSLQTWRAGAAMTTVRVNHNSVYLGNSHFMVVGGADSGAALSTAELCTIPFTPAPVASPGVIPTSVPTFAPTGAPTIAGTCTYAAPMNSVRYLIHSQAVTLGDGRVLMCGGTNAAGTTLATCEIYNPTINTWTLTGSLSIAFSNSNLFKPMWYIPSINRVITLHADVSTASIERFNPDTGTWSVVNSFPSALSVQQSILMSNGNILIACDSSISTNSFLYDPVTNSLSSTGALPLGRNSAGMANLLDGNVILVGGFHPGGAYSATTTLFNTTTRTWSNVGSLSFNGIHPTLETLPNGRVLSCGGYNVGFSPVSIRFCSLFNPTTMTWSVAPSLSTGRNIHHHLTLSTGEEVFIGGYGGSAALSSIDVYNPTTGFFRAGPTMNSVRAFHTSVALTNGRFLVIGGTVSSLAAANALNTVETCSLTGTASPPTYTCSATGSMGTVRSEINYYPQTLGNGKVLICGGSNGGALSSCELFDPALNTWSAGPTMTSARAGVWGKTQLLPDGKVAIFPGGYASSNSIDLYNPTPNTITSAATFPISYSSPMPVLLDNGNVLLVGGHQSGTAIANCYLFNPTANTVTATGSLVQATYAHQAVKLLDGNVLCIGGFTVASISNVQLYNVGLGTWSARAALPFATHGMGAVTLNNGDVFVFGGNAPSITSYCYRYNPTTNVWSLAALMPVGAVIQAFVVLSNGDIMTAGGAGGAGAISSTAIYNQQNGLWRVGATMTTTRQYNGLVILPNGNLLTMGGQDVSNNRLSSAEICQFPFTSTPTVPPSTPSLSPTSAVTTTTPTSTPTIAMACSSTGNMIANRASIRSLGVTLTDGRVLVCGGTGLTSCETFNPDTGTWTARGSMSVVREGSWSNALRLNDGRVAYFPSEIATTTVDIFDPNTNLVTAFIPLVVSISATFGVLLNDGRVLLVGGHLSGTGQVTCHMLDFALNTVRLTGSLIAGFYAGYAVRLQNGNVLTIGGYSNPNSIANCQLFNVVTETWSAVASLPIATHGVTATVLPNGNVFVYGGQTTGLVTTCYIYNVAGNLWSTTRSLTVANYVFPSIVFPNGEVMRIGGITGDTTTQIYDPSSGQGVWRSGPTVTSRTLAGAALLLDGRVLYFGAGTAQICTSPVTITNTPTSVVATIAPTMAPTATYACVATGSMGIARYNLFNKGILLNDGRVLVCGGATSGGTALSSCELFNPMTNTWSATVSMSITRGGGISYNILLTDGRVAFFNTGTGSSTVVDVFDPVSNTIYQTVPLLISNDGAFPVLLTDGTVLLIGGASGAANCYIYDFTANTIRSTGSLIQGVNGGFAVRLQNGNVLMIAGWNGGANVQNNQLYNVALGTWSSVASYPVTMRGHMARLLNNGNVLSCGGYDESAGYSSACYVYNVQSNYWSSTASMFSGIAAILLTVYPNGDIIRAGGEVSGACTNTVQFYSQTTMQWRSGPTMLTLKCYNGVVALRDGRLLVFGGWNGAAALGTAELCPSPITTGPTPAPNGATPSPTSNSIAPTQAPTTVGSCVATGSTATAHDEIENKAQLLQDGRVLVCGGINAAGTAIATCEIFNPLTNLWTSTGSMSVTRYGHWSYTLLLPDGRVAAFVGTTGASTVVEVYDPIAGTWSSIVPLPLSYQDQFPILLFNSTVLIASGHISESMRTECYLIDFAANTVRATGSLITGHNRALMVKLQNGNVLQVGGWTGSNIATCSIYNVATGIWSAVASYPIESHGLRGFLLSNGNVLVCGGWTSSALNTCYVYMTASNIWATAATMVTTSHLGSYNVLSNGEIFFTGGEPGIGTSQIYNIATGLWRAGPVLTNTRRYHSGVVLQDGRVLLAGGQLAGVRTTVAEICTVSLASTPITRSPTVTFTIAPTIAPTSSGPSCVATASMANVRASTYSDAVLLNDGRVLVCGGAATNDGTATATCEIFTPGGRFTPTGSMSIARKNTGTSNSQNMIKLQNGRVLVLPADTASSVLEIYDPITGLWTIVAPLPISTISQPTAVLLTNGNVLITAGLVSGSASALCYLYNATINTVTATGSLPGNMFVNALVALQNGNALSIGGFNGAASSTATYLYTTSTGVWSTVGSVVSVRNRANAILMPDGKVLMCGGQDVSATTTCQRYDPVAAVWATASPLTTARALHQMILLPNGEVWVLGGTTNNINTGAQLSTEIMSVNGVWRAGPNMTTQRFGHSAVLLSSGRILTIGGTNAANTALNTAEICTNAFQQLPAETFTPTAPGLTFSPTSTSPTPSPVAACTAGASMSTVRGDFVFSLILLTNGNVLAIGGLNGGGTALATTEIYNPLLNTWTASGSMTNARASQLPRGIVTTSTGLIYAGQYDSNGPQIYHQNLGVWTATATMPASYSLQEATALDNGRVLLSGGVTAGARTVNCFLFDPVLNTVTATGSLPITLDSHSTVKLQNGNVLTIGGYTTTGGSADTLNCYLYNTVAGTWSLTGTLPFARRHTRSILLNSGKVLLSGGYGDAQSPTVLNNCHIYDPVTAIWSTTGSMINRRIYHSLVLLPNGNVQSFSGYHTGYFLGSEIYNVNTGTWSVAASPQTVSAHFSAVFIPSINKTLVAGGLNTAGTRISSTELCSYP